MPTRPAVIDLPAFLTAVRACGVLSRADAARALADLPANLESADAAARWLVARGFLTAFHAERLLAGKPGGLVLGQYVILGPIGGTDTGRVFKAKHRRMDRFAAIKVLSAKLADDPVARETFKAEARSAARITHPNVVTVLDVNTIGDRPYLIREYVDGVTAADMVKSFGPMDLSAACEIVRQAALGLQHAHERGVVHGAFGPKNLLVGKDGTRHAAKVANFGIARLGGGPRSTIPCPSADVHAIGRTLTYLIAGKEPDSAVILPLPPSVSAVLQATQAADPAARPTAGTVANALTPFAHNGDATPLMILKPLDLPEATFRF
ncbi:MAG: serine/threonine-protein kinase [Fimbriiglobus sp.]